MNKIEKLRKQQEANEKKLKKASHKRWLKWFNGCLKLINKRIKQAVKNGKSEIRVETDDLFHTVSREIWNEFNFTYLVKKVTEKLHEDGFYSFYYPGCDWVSAYVDVSWAKVDNPIQKFKNECKHLMSLKYTRAIGIKYYMSLLELTTFLKDDKIKEAIDKNMDPENYLKQEFSYLFEEE